MRSVVDRIPDAGVSADGLLRGDFAHLSSLAFGLSGIPEGAGEDFRDGALCRRGGGNGDLYRRLPGRGQKHGGKGPVCGGGSPPVGTARMEDGPGLKKKIAVTGAPEAG